MRNLSVIFIFIVVSNFFSIHTAHAVTKVAIYQGSFDPLTSGHEKIIQTLLTEYDDVYVIPDRTSTYKKLMPFKIRNEMIKRVSSRLEASISNKKHKIKLLSEPELKNLEKEIKGKNLSASGTEMWDINLYIIQKYKQKKEIEFYNVVGADVFTWLIDPIYSTPMSAGPLEKMILLVIDRAFVFQNKQVTGYDDFVRIINKKEIFTTVNNEKFFHTQRVIVNQISDISNLSSTKTKHCLKAIQKITNDDFHIPNTLTPS